MEKQFQCTKIKDGLYLGNIVAAQDPQFLITNKFSYIINCTSQIPNYFQQIGIKYLNFKLLKNKQHKFWQNPKTQIQKIHKIQQFVKKAQKNSLCCLIHSFDGTNRSIMILASLLMIKFKWKSQKTLQFLKSKNLFIGLSNNYIKQLQILQEVLTQQLLKLKQQKIKLDSDKCQDGSQYSQSFLLSQKWDDAYQSYDEQIVSKTYLNSLQNDNNSYQIKQKVLKNENNKNLAIKQNNYTGQTLQAQLKKKIKKVTWKINQQKQQLNIFHEKSKEHNRNQQPLQKNKLKNKKNTNQSNCPRKKIMTLNSKQIQEEQKSKKQTYQNDLNQKQKQVKRIKKHHSNSDLGKNAENNIKIFQQKKNDYSKQMKKKIKKFISQQSSEQYDGAIQNQNCIKQSETQIIKIIKDKINLMRSNQNLIKRVDENEKNNIFNVTINNYIQPQINYGQSKKEMNRKQRKSKDDNKQKKMKLKENNIKMVRGACEKIVKNNEFNNLAKQENKFVNINRRIQKQLLSPNIN